MPDDTAAPWEVKLGENSLNDANEDIDCLCSPGLVEEVYLLAETKGRDDGQMQGLVHQKKTPPAKSAAGGAAKCMFVVFIGKRYFVCPLVLVTGASLATVKDQLTGPARRSPASLRAKILAS